MNATTTRQGHSNFGVRTEVYSDMAEFDEHENDMDTDDPFASMITEEWNAPRDVDDAIPDDDVEPMADNAPAVGDNDTDMSDGEIPIGPDTDAHLIQTEAYPMATVSPFPAYKTMNDTDERDASQDAKAERQKGKKGRKGPVIVGLVVGCLLIALISIYVYGVNKYQTHLFPNTQEDGIDLGGMTVDEANAVLDTSDWKLSIKDITGDTVTLDKEQVGLSVTGRSPAEILADQNPLAWPLHVISQNEASARTVDYDEGQIRTTVAGLDMTNLEKRDNPTDATYRYDNANHQWYVVPDTQGNLVDAGALGNAVVASMNGLESPTVEVTHDMLVNPKIRADDTTLNTAISDANKWSNASMVYNIDDKDSAETLSADTIASWVSISQNEDGTFQANLDEDKLKAYVHKIGSAYDTEGTPITITTPTGKVASVPGTEKNTGWVTDEATEITNLTSDIKNGTQGHREFAMKQRASNKTGADIWGTTYIEIDLGTQQLWYIENGEVKTSFGIISGKSGYETPQGITKVYRKVTDATLISPWKDEKGEPTYKSHIDVGLVISADSNILIHNAPWQPSSMFGSASYHWKGGSHGCVNAPDGGTWELYNTVKNGTPVITHG